MVTPGEFPHLLQPDLFDGMWYGAAMRSALERSARLSANEIAESTDPGAAVSIVIRTLNDRLYLENLFNDMDQQAFASDIEIILADSGSSDRTVPVAESLGRAMGRAVTVVSVPQADFNYPRGLNQAFRAASNPYILSIVGHERLATTRTLDAVVRGAIVPEFGGAYGPALPNANATRSERIGARTLGVHRMLDRPCVMNRREMGIMASDRAVISREAWEAVGGYDEASYGAGGEDGDLARKMMAAGLKVIRDPVLTMHHTHGLGPVRSAAQIAEWLRVSRPHPYSARRQRWLGLPQF